MKEYTVKIKDNRQNCLQTLTEFAESPNEANQKALQYLRKAFKHSEFGVKSCKPKY